MAEDMETVGRRSSTPSVRGARPACFIRSRPREPAALRGYGHRWDAWFCSIRRSRPAGHRLHEPARNFEIALSNWARQRSRRVLNVDELARYFKSSRRLQRWVPGAADLMARATTRPAEAGGAELVCPPEFEAQIYVENANSPAWSGLAKLADRLLVISSDYDAPDVDPPGLVSKALRSELSIRGRVGAWQRTSAADRAAGIRTEDRARALARARISDRIRIVLRARPERHAARQILLQVGLDAFTEQVRVQACERIGFFRGLAFDGRVHGLVLAHHLHVIFLMSVPAHRA